MIDPDGVEWLPVAEAATRAGIDPSLIYVWVHRRKVQAHRVHRQAFVRMPDVLDAEHAWRTRTGGHPRRSLRT